MPVVPKEGGPYSLFCTDCGVWTPNTANAEMKKEGVYSHSHVCGRLDEDEIRDIDYQKTKITAKEAKKLLSESEKILDSGERTQFQSGAVRDMHEGKGRCDLLPMCVLIRLSKHFERGAIKYQERNWEKGIPAHSFADSAMRHMFKYMDGQRDEDHLIAAIWNLCCLAWTEEKRPEMMDIPSRKEPDQ